MSYTIQLDALSWSYALENLTFEAVKGHDASLIEFYEDLYGSDYPESFESTEEKADFIRESDSIHEIDHCFEPVRESAHILQCSEVDDESLIKLHRIAPDLVILRHAGKYLIGGARNDVFLGACIAYAYMILDKFVPPSAVTLTLRHEGKGLTREEYSELVHFINSQ